MSSTSRNSRHLQGLARVLAMVAMAVVAGLLAAACASPAPPPAPTKAPAAPAPAPTTAPAPAAAPTKAPAAPAPTAAPTAAPKAAWRPSKAPTFIVQYAAGGGVDINVRIIAQNATKYLGQQIAVVNKATGAGIPGTTEVVQSKPDGLTLGIMATAWVTSPYLLKGTPWKFDDMLPILQIAFEPNVLVAQPGMPADKPLKELMAYLKANTGKMRMAVGTSWTGHEFTRATMELAGDFTVQTVQYSGGAPATQALLAGDVDLAVPYVSEVIQHIQAGKLKPIAISGPARVKQFPDVPTFTEMGYPDINWGVFRMIGLPKATPNEIVTAYHDVFKQTLDDPATKEAYDKAGIDLVYLNATDSLKSLQGLDARVQAVIKKLGLQPQ